MKLKDKNIILGVTGSIAAYKAAYLLRYLVKEGANVQVLMSEAGKNFITPTTMSALSGRPVLGSFFEKSDGMWHSHVDLGLWADLMIIAPASANTIAKMAGGLCDNLLLTTYLSAKCPVVVAPAMDLDMFKHPATQANIAKIEAFGNEIIQPTSGELASGLEGKGRMEEPEEILNYVIDFFAEKDLKGLKMLVNAGPTRENIDPVRYVSNYSTGKMGYALAEELASRGAEVKLVSGPVDLKVKHKNIELIKAKTADEMFVACSDQFKLCDGAILTAAVADYTPENVSPHKIKSSDESMQLNMIATKDIAAALGKQKNDKQFIVGFALETCDSKNNALDKLEKKNLDMIVLNSLEDEGAGFGTDTNKICIIRSDNNVIHFDLKHKAEVASDIVNEMKMLSSCTITCTNKKA